MHKYNMKPPAKASVRSKLISAMVDNSVNPNTLLRTINSLSAVSNDIIIMINKGPRESGAKITLSYTFQGLIKESLILRIISRFVNSCLAFNRMMGLRS